MRTLTEVATVLVWPRSGTKNEGASEATVCILIVFITKKRLLEIQRLCENFSWHR